uniref:GGDEF domain-containing response regulator n=1 Tax=Paenirhodobacter enshiensis TaxID=1105367 RepID=UPI0035B25FA6
MTGRILIVDNGATSRIMLKARIAEARYPIATATTAREALAHALHDPPMLVIAAMALPDLDGLSLCRRLHAQPGRALLPVLLMAGTDDAALRLAALEAGASDVLSASSDGAELLARMRAALRRAAAEQDLSRPEDSALPLGLDEDATPFRPSVRIALIAAARDTPGQKAPPPETVPGWRGAFARQLRGDCLLRLGPAEALALASGRQCPEAFVLSPDLSARAEGLRLVAELRARAGARESVLCVSDNGDPENRRSAASALDLGADDLLPAATAADSAEAAVRLHRLIERRHRLQRRRAELAEGLRLATIDPLTGLHNRRYAMPQIARMAEVARQTGSTLAVMALDLDRFKQINDRWGHATGDAVLATVAQRLRDTIRPGDLLARTGGEEFLIALPDSGLTEARALAEQVLRATRVPITGLPGAVPELTVTVSVGLAITPQDPDPGRETRPMAPEVLLDRADRALMRSKTSGRDQIRVFDRSAA